VRRRPGSEILSLVFPPSSGPPPPGVEEPLSRGECLQRAAPCGAVRGTSRIATSCIATSCIATSCTAEDGGHQRRAVPSWPGPVLHSWAPVLPPLRPVSVLPPLSASDLHPGGLGHFYVGFGLGVEFGLGPFGVGPPRLGRLLYGPPSPRAKQASVSEFPNLAKTIPARPKRCSDSNLATAIWRQQFSDGAPKRLIRADPLR
jgi:hypothetical protein